MFGANRILITGGTGALGKALLKFAAEIRTSAQIVILSRDPIKQQQIRKEFEDFNLYFVTGDVADMESVAFAMSGCDLVIHAAAMKHIPEGERDPLFACESNINGSIVVAHCAMQAKVDRVIGISTDKACQPLNAYGATKLLMEKIFQAYNDISQTDFHIVRYGNVIGSTGSVIRVWREMEARDGIVYATSPDMRRFWITPAQAVKYIGIALDEPGGTITVPAMKCLGMGELANIVLKSDTQIIYNGLRPGEKPDEIMISPEEMKYTEFLPGNQIYRLWPVGTDVSGVDVIPFYGTSNTPAYSQKEFMEEFAEVL